ncbi:hypothetical protein DRI96_05630 [Candidatus Aerophobetes bacterium]|uniref:Carbohydrate kinase FGGY N-terminal domain-containing protein n=1 Tax=Aerophobetes bacterium TaxID=2030807 RepID=A0A662DBT6_UNCAE|nr:MAG: hypothetical protein DRI96_05630 [Candidatus Aerophobetes bacterium]
MWDKEILREIGIDEGKLPPVYPCDDIVGKVTEKGSTVTGLKEGTPVVTGSVDANAAYLSAGVIDDGENALTMGSTACWGMAHTADKFIPGLICMPHIAYSRGWDLLLDAIGKLADEFPDKKFSLELCIKNTENLIKLAEKIDRQKLAEAQKSMKAENSIAVIQEVLKI